MAASSSLAAWSSQCWSQEPLTAIPRRGEPGGSPVRGSPARRPAPTIQCEMSAATAHDRRPRSGGRRAHRGRPRARARAAGGEGLARRRSSGRLAFLAVAVPFALLALRPGGLAGRARPPRGRATPSRRGSSSRSGSGFAVPTQIVFVPMLFLLPVGLVPLCVARRLPALRRSVDLVRGRVHGERALLEVFSAWHALGPALVLALAGEPAPTWSRAAAARRSRSLAQFALRLRQLGCARPLRVRRPRARAAPAHRARRTSSTPRSRRPASSSRSSPSTQPFALAARPPAPRAARLLRARAARAGSTTRSSSGTPTAARRFLLGDVIEADDAYTGTPQPRRRRARRRRRRRARARRARAAATPS